MALVARGPILLNRRTAIALAIVCAHTLVLQSLLSRPDGQRVQAWRDEPLVLLPAPDAIATVVTVDLSQELTTPVRPAPEVRAPPQVAIPATDDTGEVPAATPTDLSQVERICGGGHGRGGRQAGGDAVIIVLARVEADGKVSDTRIEHSSGREPLDAAVQHCLQTMALLTPVIADSRPVASWQRLAWSIDGVAARRDR